MFQKLCLAIYDIVPVGSHYNCDQGISFCIVFLLVLLFYFSHFLFIFHIKVFPAESVDIEDQLHSIRFGNLSLLGKAVGKGDYQRAAQLISELSASMNNNDDEELEVNKGDSTTRIKDRLNLETKEIVSFICYLLLRGQDDFCSKPS